MLILAKECLMNLARYKVESLIRRTKERIDELEQRLSVVPEKTFAHKTTSELLKVNESLLRNLMETLEFGLYDLN